MMALEKDRNRRYSSVQALAADIDRFLDSLPIAARPQSAAYLTRKFMSRHRVGVTTGVMVALVVIAGGVVSTVGFIEASKARREAEAKARTAERVSQFVASMLEDANPFGEGSADMSAREMLERALPRIESDLEGELEVQAALRVFFGRTYQGYGEYATASELYQQAIDDFMKLEGDTSQQAAAVYRSMAWTFQKGGQYDEAILAAENGLEIARSLRGDTSVLVGTLLDVMGDTYRFKGNLKRAETLLREAYDILHDVKGGPGIIVKNDLALVLLASGKMQEAETMFREVVEQVTREHGPDAPYVNNMGFNLAAILYRQRRMDEAESLYQRIYEVRARRLGEDHPFTAATRLELIRIQIAREEFAAAHAQLAPIVEKLKVDSTTPSDLLAKHLRVLAQCLNRLDRYNEAELAITESLEIYTRLLDPASPSLVSYRRTLATALVGQGRYEDAETLLLSAHARLDSTAVTASVMNQSTKSLVDLYESWGKADQAAEWSAKLQRE
jgi:tetratricopeptide (TPR) repeat protein